MNNFLKKSILFLSPFFIYLLLAGYIDPFDVIRKEDVNDMKVLKKNIAGKINYPLYKLVQFGFNPTKTIILGDSRSAALKAEVFSQITQKEVFNLAYGGATLTEVAKTFWEITKVHKLKEVYIGINFNLYNQYNSRNRVEEAIELKRSFFPYLLSNYCLKSTFLITKSFFLNKSINIEKPPYNKEEFWKYQLNVSADNFYSNYKYPAPYKESLQKIADYCSKNKIKLIFFIPPTHISLQQKVKEYDLIKEEIKFKSDLSKIAKVYNFDYPNSLTENKDNFRDPFHFIDKLSELIIKEIVTGKLKHAQLLE